MRSFAHPTTTRRFHQSHRDLITALVDETRVNRGSATIIQYVHCALPERQHHVHLVKTKDLNLRQYLGPHRLWAAPPHPVLELAKVAPIDPRQFDDRQVRRRKTGRYLR